jgi:predicted transcriptional regulator of viral defense system
MPHIGRVEVVRRHELDRCIAAIAATQHGLITLVQLRDLGVTPAMIRTRRARGSLHPIYRGVFSVGHAPITEEARWLAAVLACGDGALLSHCSAAALWRVRKTSSSIIDVTAPTRRGFTLRNVAVHRATTLAPADIDICRSVPVTSLPRTIIDLATVVGPGSLEYAIHSAERQRKLTPANLHEILARLPGVSGTAKVRKMVGRPGHDLDARTRSRWELRFLEICRAHEIPMPRVNEWIALDIAAGGLEVDFSWPDRRLVVEVDEEAGHTTTRSRKNDPLRDAALRAAGWRVLRVAEQQFEDPPLIAASVLRAVAQSFHYPRPSPWRRRSSP